MRAVTLIGLLIFRLQSNSASQIISVGRSPTTFLTCKVRVLRGDDAWGLQVHIHKKSAASRLALHWFFLLAASLTRWDCLLQWWTCMRCVLLYSSCCCGPRRLHPSVGLSRLGSSLRTAPHAVIGSFLAGWWCLVQSCLQTSLISPSQKKRLPCSTQY